MNLTGFLMIYSAEEGNYLIQMRSNTLFVCEVKWRRREIGMEVIDAMKTKIASLTYPKGFGISPILFHLGAASDALLSNSFFYRIVDVAELANVDFNY